MKSKALKGMTPNYIQQLFNSCNNRDYQLWGNNLKLYLPKWRINFLKNIFSYRGASSWNRIPTNTSRLINDSNTLTAVNKLIDNYFNKQL